MQVCYPHISSKSWASLKLQYDIPMAKIINWTEKYINQSRWNAAKCTFLVHFPNMGGILSTVVCHAEISLTTNSWHESGMSAEFPITRLVLWRSPRSKNVIVVKFLSSSFSILHRHCINNSSHFIHIHLIPFQSRGKRIIYLLHLHFLLLYFLHLFIFLTSKCHRIGKPLDGYN